MLTGYGARCVRQRDTGDRREREMGDRREREMRDGTLGGERVLTGYVGTGAFGDHLHAAAPQALQQGLFPTLHFLT